MRIQRYTQLCDFSAQIFLLFKKSIHQNCKWITISRVNYMILFHSAYLHYSDVIISAMAFQIISVLIVSSTVCPGADKRKHQSYASLAFVRRIHRWTVTGGFPQKGSATRKIFSLDDVIMICKMHNPIHAKRSWHGPILMRLIQPCIHVFTKTRAWLTTQVNLVKEYVTCK